MRSIPVVLLALASLVAIQCRSTATDPTASACAAAVMVRGVLYQSGKPQAEPPSGVQLAEPFSEVKLFDPRCNDTINGEGSHSRFSMEDGESNFLPRGTPLYRIDGWSASERLTASSDRGWVVLAPVGAGSD